MSDLINIERTIEMKEQVENGISYKCGICGGDDCWIMVSQKDRMVKVVFQRGQIFLCERCYRDSIFFDNLSYNFWKPLLKIRRKLGL